MVALPLLGAVAELMYRYDFAYPPHDRQVFLVQPLGYPLHVIGSERGALDNHSSMNTMSHSIVDNAIESLSTFSLNTLTILNGLIMFLSLCNTCGLFK